MIEIVMWWWCDNDGDLTVNDTAIIIVIVIYSDYDRRSDGGSDRDVIVIMNVPSLQHAFLLPGTSWRAQQEQQRRNWTDHPGQANYQALWVQQAHANQQRHRADTAGSARHPEQPRTDGVPAVTWLPRAHLLAVLHHWWVELFNPFIP